MVNSRSVLIVGNFLSLSAGNKTGGSYGVCEELAERLEDAGWHVLRVSSKRNRVLKFMDMILCALAHRQEYAVAQVDVYSGWAFLWVWCLSYLLNVLRKPFVLTLHGGLLPLYALRFPGRVRRVLSRAAVVTTPSGYLLELMSPYTSRLRLLPNPLDMGKYVFRHRSVLAPRLLWLRAFHGIYNPEMAVRVVALLKKDFPEVQLMMVGPDKGDGSFQRVKYLSEKLDVENNLFLTGSLRKSEIPRVLNSADVLINTTNVDNAPVSVLEAMVSGLCIVSTNAGGLPYMLDHGNDALLVPPDDSNEMAASLKKLLQDPELAGRLSLNARTKALKCDWSVVLPKWENLLSEAAGNG